MRSIRMAGMGIVSAVSGLLLMSAPPATSSGKASTYGGWAGCGVCHAEIAEDWLKTRHSRALESLKKTNQENLPECVKCHVTGYEQDGGFIDNELTPEMAGVQCEECHGPGSGHVSDPAAKPVQAKVPGVEACRRCHTDRQDPGFSYEKKSLEVHGKPS